MNLFWYIIVLCVASWALVSWVLAPQVGVEIFLGMIAPLLLAIGTVLMVRRVYQREPTHLTAFMTKALLGKMVLYGVYVSLVVGWFAFEAIPFAISFTIYFIGLHLAEALHLRAIFRGA